MIKTLVFFLLALSPIATKFNCDGWPIPDLSKLHLSKTEIRTDIVEGRKIVVKHYEHTDEWLVQPHDPKIGGMHGLVMGVSEYSDEYGCVFAYFLMFDDTYSVDENGEIWEGLGGTLGSYIDLNRDGKFEISTGDVMRDNTLKLIYKLIFEK